MKNLELQIDYWNRVGPSKPFAHPVNLELWRHWVPPSSRVMDFGCGYGRVLGTLHENGYHTLIGFDPASAMITAARRKFPAITFEVLDDFRNVGLPDASIDAIVLFAVLTSVPSNDGQRAILAEISRLLAPSGKLYISDMWLQTDSRNIERYSEGEKKYGTYGVFDLAEGVTVRHHDRKWIESLTSGYEKLALEDVFVHTMNGNPATAFQWFGQKTAS